MIPAAPELGHHVLPGSVSHQIGEYSDNNDRSTTHRKPPLPAPGFRSNSAFPRPVPNADGLKRRLPPITRASSEKTERGKSERRRTTPGKSTSVRSLITRSNTTVNRSTDGSVDGSSGSDILQADAGKDQGINGENFANGEESAHLAVMTDPAIPISPPGSLPRPLDSSSPRNSKFTGPLQHIYPENVIIRPQRKNEEIWAKVMDVNEHWLTHAAEDSGLTTFWQAMLAASRSLHTAIIALSTLAERGQLKDWMVKNVAMATGQVANAIGLAWQHDHLDNLARLPESEKRNLNIDAQERRHDQLLKRIWSVLNQLDETFHDARVNPGHTESVEVLRKKLKDFYGYLTVTVKLVLEDALFFYRNAMTESKFSCVGHVRNSHGRIDPAMWSATLALIVGLTPPHQRMRCLRVMGYSWIASKALCVREGVIFKWNFERPLNAVSLAASKLERRLGSSTRRTW